MRPWTERLLQIAAALAILYYGWQLAAQTVVTLLVTQQQLARCQSQLGQPGAAPKGTP